VELFVDAVKLISFPGGSIIKIHLGLPCGN
jgi:hypothetical protein